MTQSEIISQTEQYVLHTYNRFPVALDRGNGMRVWDTEGRSYLDFMSGIGVYALGYDADQDEFVWTFTAMSQNGQTLWGVRATGQD